MRSVTEISVADRIDTKISGTIFAVKRFAIHDGPHIRTTIFLKGCPLRCVWCHNPEGIDPEVKIVINDKKCIGCSNCATDCPTGVVTTYDGNGGEMVPGCQRCWKCVEACPSLARELTGWQVSVTDVMSEIEKDVPFYDQSGGGATFSGGEPLMQHEFLLLLLKKCRDRTIHTAVDTSAHCEVEVLREVAKYADMFLIDLKHMDSRLHRQFTGVCNERILKNIRLLAKMNHRMHLRLPLIEGINSDETNILATADFVASLSGERRLDLLPYHSIGIAKYAKLGWSYPGHHLKPVSQDRIEECKRMLEGRGIRVTIGG